MVWFQCESCGDNLKKPKLQSHFQQCAAHRLSCIDCGVVFDRQSVQGHTSCVTEEVRYGPRDAFRQALANPSDGSKEAPAKAEETLELTIGLSTWPPWECSLCRVKCTSQETLQGHAQGKKHRAKARAAAKAQMEKEGAGKGVGGEAEKVTEGGAGERTSEKVPEGVSSNGEAKVEKASRKKRKGREAGDEDVKAAAAPEGGETKKGKKPKKEAADVTEQAETGVAGVEEEGLEKKATKGKKKGKKQKVLEGGDAVMELATRTGNEGMGATDADVEGKPGTKGRKRKNDDVAEGAGHRGLVEPSAEDAKSEPEAKRRSGRGKKALDEKQYWAELAETGRRKRQEEALGDGDKEKSGEGTVVNGETAQPAEEAPSKKKKRKGTPENGADADRSKGAGTETKAEAASKKGAKTAEKGSEADGAEVVKPGKLRKMMQAALQEASKHSLSVKKLLQSVLSQPAMKDDVAKDALRKQILLESATSSKFRIEGGKVSLSAES